jgi:hypothetical protein
VTAHRSRSANPDRRDEDLRLVYSWVGARDHTLAGAVAEDGRCCDGGDARDGLRRSAQRHQDVEAPVTGANRMVAAIDQGPPRWWRCHERASNARRCRSDGRWGKADPPAGQRTTPLLSETGEDIELRTSAQTADTPAKPQPTAPAHPMSRPDEARMRLQNVNVVITGATSGIGSGSLLPFPPRGRQPLCSPDGDSICPTRIPTTSTPRRSQRRDLRLRARRPRS